MRNTIIPAQITTVEDKITGNLSLTQIILLIIPVFVMTILFSFVPPVMKLGILKTILFGLSVAICGILALRIKGRVVLNWLLVWLKFKARPTYYVFDKNDDYLRESELPSENQNKTKAVAKVKAREKTKILTEIDTMKLIDLINNQKNSLSFEFNKQGGLHVSVEMAKK